MGESPGATKPRVPVSYEYVSGPTRLADETFFAKVGISPIFHEDTSFFLLPDAYHACEQANYSDLNSIVLQYLIIHGHEEAAAHLAHDAGLSMPRDRRAMQARSGVRDALLQGDVDHAVQCINEIDPEVCMLWKGERTSVFMHHAELCDAESKPNHHLSTDRLASLQRAADI